MLEHDVASHVCSIAILVLIEFGLFIQNSQNAARARNAQLHQAKGPVGVEGGIVQKHHQAHISHQAANGKLAVHDQEQSVQECANHGNCEQQRRQVPRLNQAILNEVIAVATGIALKFTFLLFFLRGCLHHFNPCHCFIQARVHFTELFAHLVCDRIQSTRVVA